MDRFLSFGGVSHKRKATDGFENSAAKKICFMDSSKSNNNLQQSHSESSEGINICISSRNESPTYDIGKYIGKKISDCMKKNLLMHHWIPPTNYSFPFSIHKKKGREERRYASHKHLNDFKWLVLSEEKKGFFCKYCPIFVINSVGGYQKNVPLGRLVTTPVVSFAKLYGKDGILDIHNKNEYHQAAIESGKDFIRLQNAPEYSIINQIDTERSRQIEENRRRLLPIVETILFHGYQNISLRGHRDFGKLENEASSVTNEGNFRELLRFRIKSGDTNLQHHLETASSRATYISNTVQNALIDCCGEEILQKIIKRVQDAEMFSVLFDETTDISKISQMSLVLRYPYFFPERENEFEVREDFVKFLDLYNRVYSENKKAKDTIEPKLTGKKIGSIVLDTLKNLNINIKKCVGITTDGCSVMTSERLGAVSRIQEEAVNAVYCPCYNHMLNLSIALSSELQSVRNAVGVMKDTIAFFSASAKRSVVFNNHFGKELSGLCETRWIERHDGILQFRQSIPKLVSALDEISQWKDPASSSKAECLSVALTRPEFLVTIVCLSDVLSCTLPLSRFFQKKQIDIKAARDLLNETITLLDRKRKMCEVKFESLFNEINSMAKIELGMVITLPRRNVRQVYKASDPATYYRQSIYIPLIDNVLEDLKARFSDESIQLYNFKILFPTSNFDSNQSSHSINILSDRYYHFFNESPQDLKQQIKLELELWNVKWENKENAQLLSAFELIKICDPDVFPYLHKLFRIFITLPISNASAERTFSCLRRLKNWLRATMEEDRLVGLALMHIHRDIKIDPYAVIDRFAKSGNHRLEFIL